jgi:hypothetical protein
LHVGEIWPEAAWGAQRRSGRQSAEVIKEPHSQIINHDPAYCRNGEYDDGCAGPTER